ncbi:hypothetical protein AAG906_011898 [Vitis piasezkii]
MKVLKMVIQEVLRLYSGVAILTRHTLKDVQLGDVSVPEGVGIWVWLPALHQDSEFWGPDAAKFNPERGLLIVFLGPATLPVPTSRLVLETELVLARA